MLHILLNFVTFTCLSGKPKNGKAENSLKLILLDQPTYFYLQDWENNGHCGVTLSLVNLEAGDGANTKLLVAILLE